MLHSCVRPPSWVQIRGRPSKSSPFHPQSTCFFHFISNLKHRLRERAVPVTLIPNPPFFSENSRLHDGLPLYCAQYEPWPACCLFLESCGCATAWSPLKLLRSSLSSSDIFAEIHYGLRTANRSEIHLVFYETIPSYNSTGSGRIETDRQTARVGQVWTTPGLLLYTRFTNSQLRFTANSSHFQVEFSPRFHFHSSCGEEQFCKLGQKDF